MTKLKLKLKKLTLATAAAGFVALTPLTLHADDNDLRQQLTQARLEGSIWTAIALNRHLSPFSINVEVEGDTAVLTGSVESDVDRDLAKQVALGVDGIERVDNRLTVDAESGETLQQSDFSKRIHDATTTATVKSKLLWNSNTHGLDINVETEDGVVTLSGTAQSSEARELAERLAANTDGVAEVRNRIEVSGDAGVAERAQQSARGVGDTVSDAWITSKVKSSYLFNRNLKGLDITVETSDGRVTLSGNVANETEKDLAEEIARNMRGVRDVDTSQLQVSG
jgi:osmotically-inducible protein OsmY